MNEIDMVVETLSNLQSPFNVEVRKSAFLLSDEVLEECTDSIFEMCIATHEKDECSLSIIRYPENCYGIMFEFDGTVYENPTGDLDYTIKIFMRLIKEDSSLNSYRESRDMLHSLLMD
jgi:hypothetical protein